MRHVAPHVQQLILENLRAFADDNVPTAISSDEELDLWGDFFVHNKLHERGILFETFVQDPREIARAFLHQRRTDWQSSFIVSQSGDHIEVT